MTAQSSMRKTAFSEIGYGETIRLITEQIQDLYLSDQIPWVLGYSGGKDSTATLQLVWNALSNLPKSKHIKPVHVISTDTLVENPVVALWVERSLAEMSKATQSQELPITPHRLTPDIKDRFWVNLIGKGYPAPRPKFRWCTSRLKISPSNNFIKNVVKNNGEAILVLGTRKAESSARANLMKKYEEGSTRELLSRNGELDRVWVYSPISAWHDDDVWQYLMQSKNPWGFKNEELLNMYQGATSDGECPLVVDTSTPSCGDSRFGCYVCTMVGEDKSMSAMIQNDDEKEWMLPLLELRTKWLDITDPNPDKKNKKIDAERQHREFKRMNGSLTIHNDRLVHGPYKQSYRAQLLEAVLEAEKVARQLCPEEVKDLELISIEELEEIRRIWCIEKHEIEDVLPKLYEKVTGKDYPGQPLTDYCLFSSEDLELLKQVCNEGFQDTEHLHYELVRDLIHVENTQNITGKRASLLGKLEKVIEESAFENEAEALEFAKARQLSRDRINERNSDASEDSLLFEDVMQEVHLK